MSGGGDRLRDGCASCAGATGSSCSRDDLQMERNSMTKFYVSTTGSVSAAGTEAAPVNTVTQGIARAKAGDTVIVRAGTYAEAVTIGKSLTLTGEAGAILKPPRPLPGTASRSPPATSRSRASRSPARRATGSRATASTTSPSGAARSTAAARAASRRTTRTGSRSRGTSAGATPGIPGLRASRPTRTATSRPERWLTASAT